MKNYNKILEAVNRGIQLALDDFDDDETPIQNIKSKQVYNRDYTKEYLDLMKYGAVTLGLPSGTLWHKYNLGSELSKLNRAYYWGKFYKWGEINDCEDGEWESYKFANGDMEDKDGMKKYGNDKLLRLKSEDDAAYQLSNFPDFNFIIPTKQQFEELLENTTSEWITNYKNYNICGQLLTSKINGQQIFFPALGYCDDEGIDATGYCSYYWTSDFVFPLLKKYPNSAWAMRTSEEGVALCEVGVSVAANIKPVIKL